MYALSPEEAIDIRQQRVKKKIDPYIFHLISDMMKANPLARTFTSAFERIKKQKEETGKELPEFKVFLIHF